MATRFDPWISQKLRTSLHGLLWVLITLMLVGCAFRNHMDAGDKYFGQAAYEEALNEYEAALRIDPGSEHAQVKVKETREKLAGEWTEEARQKVSGGDHIGAIVIAGKAYNLTPDNADIQSLVTEISSASADHADSLAKQEQFLKGMRIYEAMTGQLPEEHAQVRGRSEAFKQSWAAKLSEMGLAAGDDGRHGEALLLWSKAATLSTDPRFRQHRDELRKELREVYAYRVYIAGSKRDGVFQKLYPRLSAYTGPQNILVMDSSANKKEAHAVFTLEFSKISFKDNVHAMERSGEYQSGTKQVENPFYKTRQDEVVNAEKNLLNAERSRDEVQVKLERAKASPDIDPNDNVSTMAEQDVQRYGSDLEAARRKITDSQNALENARESLRNTASTTEEAVFSTHTYTVKSTTVSGSLPTKGEIVHNDDRPAVFFQTAVQVSANDESHDAQNLLNLAADPLQLPSKDALTSDLYTNAYDLGVSKMLESFNSYRATLLTRAFSSEDNTKVDILALYILLDTSVVDPSVGAEIERLRDIPDALEVLTAP